MIVTLEVSDNKSKVRRVTLKSDAVIGRSADCNLRIASGQVSRHHCRIRVTDTQVSVKDLGSSNGTFLNGEALPPNEDFPISSGAQIAVGPVRFVARFELAQNTLGSPGSTREMPVVADGQTAAEALAQQASPIPEQVAGGAVAGAMAAAAKAEQQAPQQIDELVELVKSPEGTPKPPDDAEQVPAASPEETLHAEETLQAGAPPNLGEVEVALPAIPSAGDEPNGDETADWTDTLQGPPSDVRASASAVPVAKAVGSTVELPESEDDAPATPAEPQQEPTANAEAVPVEDDIPLIEFEEFPAPDGDIEFTEAAAEPADALEATGEELEELEEESEEVEEIEIAADQPDEEEEPPPRKKGGKRSLFGLLGRKKQADAEASQEESAAVEAEAEGEQEWEYEETDEPEESEEYEYEYEYEYEEVPADEAVADQTVNVSEDEIASYLDGDETEKEAPPAPADDGSLGDFLKNLGDS